ncbi:hypothetical protein [Rhizobium sp. RM]|uniref:hypothetical protein n=1 Tax=Rhizobium sp. RM TaxID=2748079 RepID=UPI00110E8EE0|nr:hypothetical protein [Rhizobium sp. RM]NWJ25373.1 hypothetical protein [Rhizobium sp. RM]TMV17543.1 hypothetical protein BJG94_16360 [Rhizobium sp. Td3]
MKTIKRWMKNIAAMVMIYVLAVMMAGAFKFYGCFNRIGDDEVLDAAKQAYWERWGKHKLAEKSPQVIFCNQPESVVDDFWGIPLGWEWEARCTTTWVASSWQMTPFTSTSAEPPGSGNQIEVELSQSFQKLILSSSKGKQ